MFGGVVAHSRVQQRHPELSDEDVAAAWRNAVAVRRRSFDPPEYYAAAGADPHGRMIEMVGVELEDSRLLIFHAMRLTPKMADELCIGRESR